MNPLPMFVFQITSTERVFERMCVSSFHSILLRVLVRKITHICSLMRRILLSLAIAVYLVANVYVSVWRLYLTGDLKHVWCVLLGNV